MTEQQDESKKHIKSFIGNLGADPAVFVVRKTEAKAVRFSLAVGNQDEETRWYTVLCFDPQIAEVIEEHVKKGTRVRVQGRVQTSFVAVDGQLKQYQEIIMDGPFALL